MKAVFVTTNEHKRREVQEVLGIALVRTDLDVTGYVNTPNVERVNSLSN